MALRNDLKIGLAIGGLAVFLLVLVLYLAFTQPPKAGVATAGGAGGTGSAPSSAEKPTPTASGTGGAAKPEDNLTGQIVIPDNINPNPAKPNNPGVATAGMRNPMTALPPLIGSEITPKPNPTSDTRQEENTWLQRYGDGPTPPDVTQTPGPAAPNRTFANPDGTPAGPARTAGGNVGGTSSPSSESTAAGGKTYTVQAGDTLTGIAQKVYGRTGAYVVLAAANPGVDPARMRVGTTLTLPDASAARAESPAPAPVATGPNQHRVEQGETLSSIAKQSLGSEARWEQLYDLNRDQIGSDPGALKLGMVLKLPQ